MELIWPVFIPCFNPGKLACGKVFRVSDMLTKVPDSFVNFPAQLNDGLDKTRLVFSSDRVTWYRPTSLDDLLTLKSTYPDAKLVIGNTEVGRKISVFAL